MSHSTKIAEILSLIIHDADDALVHQLADALETFAKDSPQAFKGVQNTPFSEVIMGGTYRRVRRGGIKCE